MPSGILAKPELIQCSGCPMLIVRDHSRRRFCGPCSTKAHGISDKRYHERNRDKRLSYLKEWQRKNGAASNRKFRTSGAGKTWEREYRQCAAYKAKQARRAHRRRQRTKSTISDLTADQWKQILDAYNRHCAYCLGRLPRAELHRDHFIPVVDGGGLTAANVVPACPSCNSRKGAGRVELACYRRR